MQKLPSYNRTFWTTIPLRYTKLSKSEKKGNVISCDEEICSAFNDFFENTLSNLNIPAIEHSHLNLQNTDPILTTVNSYEKHPIIERIKNISCNLMFSFTKPNSNEVIKIIDNLNIRKVCHW